MYNGSKLLFVALVSLLAGLAVASKKDVPCNVREGSGGYICVCNSTYCDTVRIPTKLARNSYYHYSTSETTPGFTKAVKKFLNTTAVDQPANTMSSDVYIKVDATKQYQTYEGIGASFTDNSGTLIRGLPAKAQQKFIESIFGVTGLEYTFARVPIACSDFSPKVYSYDDVPGDAKLKHFNLTEEDHLLKIPFIKMAKKASKRGVNLIGTSWTAPTWMKTNNGSTPAYILKKYEQSWARYHLKFLQAYKKLGVEFWGISQGNEVTLPLFFGPFFGMPNTIMMPAQTREWTKKYFGPIIKKNGFKNVKILSLEDERPFLSWWADRLFSDKKVRSYVDGVALHWYLDSTTSTYLLDDFHKNYTDKFLFYTESSINGFQGSGGAVDLGDWSRAVRYINNMFMNLNHWVIGYLDWNIALNEDGGPTGPTDITLDAAVIINVTTGEFYKQPLHYVLGHFSKFIHPGSKKINVTISQVTNETYYMSEKESLENLFKSKMFNTKLNNVAATESTPVDRSRGTRGTRPTGGTRPSGGTPPTGGTRASGGTRPTGSAPTGGSAGTGSTGSGSQTTESPFPTRQPDPATNTVQALATINPDGSHTVIAYNPRSVSANLIITDTKAGTLNQTVEAHSLNSFVYWPKSKITEE